MITLNQKNDALNKWFSFYSSSRKPMPLKASKNPLNSIDFLE